MVSLQKTTLKMVDRSLRLLQFWGGHMWKDLHSSENISFLGSRDTQAQPVEPTVHWQQRPKLWEGKVGF